MFRFSRTIGSIVLFTLIFIGLIIGFFVTGYTELLFIAIFIGLFDIVFIGIIHEPLMEFIKYLQKGLKTGEWE